MVNQVFLNVVFWESNFHNITNFFFKKRSYARKKKNSLNDQT